MQQDSRVVARHWLNAARVPQVAAFHTQQAAEKAIKAVLVWQAGDAPRSHLIQTLLDDLQTFDSIVPDEVCEAAQSLEKHYIPSRYPDALGGGDPARSYTIRDAVPTREAAALVLEWAEAACK